MAQYFVPAEKIRNIYFTGISLGEIVRVASEGCDYCILYVVICKEEAALSKGNQKVMLVEEGLNIQNDNQTSHPKAVMDTSYKHA